MKQITIPTPKRHTIAATVFDAQPQTVVIIAPATGVKQLYYKRFAQFLQSNGITAITFDYYGIGQSKNLPIKNIDVSVVDWGTNDIETVLQYVRKNYSNAQIILIGHSVGGQLFGLCPSAVHAAKIILVGAQTGYWKFWKGFGKITMWLNWYIVFPTLTAIFGYLPSSKFSAMEDLPKGIAKQWRTWCISPNFLFDTIDGALLHYDAIKCDIISYSAFDDTYAPKRAVDWMTEKYSNAKIQRKHLSPADVYGKPIGHFGFFQPKHKETIWNMFLHDIQNSK